MQALLAVVAVLLLAVAVFAFQNPDAVAVRFLHWELSASASGFFPGIAWGAAAGDCVELTLAREWALAGRVLDLESQPVGGARDSDTRPGDDVDGAAR